MPRLLVLVLTALLLASGCSGAARVENSKVPPRLAEADLTDCENQAYLATASLTSQGQAETRRETLVDACMKSKGYAVK